MKQQKRGGIELSMTTIIVIVLGVVLLTLGLVWVRGIFKDVTDISDDAFSRARDIISGLEDVDSLLTLIPEEVEVGQAKDEVVKVVIANFEENPIRVTAKILIEGDKLKCGFLEGDQFAKSSGPYTLESGDQKALALIVKDNNGNLRTTSCKIKIDGVESADNEQSLIIRVVKEQSLLG